ncbi:unnamed protein product [Sphenostylis stenocarpa]|uniref:Uncharacterized protein n=1 Tax=Sphenostylis stenocarpa TaxID=92480 RepID=A0AA86RTS2_9FABA|nr:unnamed protein product [Sphenostylis stenocarpa]
MDENKVLLSSLHYFILKFNEKDKRGTNNQITDQLSSVVIALRRRQLPLLLLRESESEVLTADAVAGNQLNRI